MSGQNGFPAPARDAIWGPSPLVRWMAPDDGARYDVVVVGAGISGMSAAVMAAERGASVCVIARHPLHASVTGRSNAKVTSLHQAVYRTLTSEHGAEAARIYADACQAAVRWVDEHAGDLLQPRDAVTVAVDEQQALILEEEHQAARDAGLEAVLLPEGTDWPQPTTGALRLPGQGQVDPVALLEHLAATAGDSVALRSGVVRGVLDGVRGARVRGDGWSVQAGQVILATGLPIADRGLFFAQVEPQASYIVAIEQADEHVPEAQDMMITAGDSLKRSVRWAGEPGALRVLVGGEGHRTGVFDGSATDRTTTLEAWAREHFHGLGRTVARWSAEDFSTTDRLPLAGPLLRAGGHVHVITGLNKWGFTLGVACAEAIVTRISEGTTSPFADLVDTARLPRLTDVPGLARAQSAVGMEMVSGWVRGLSSRAPDIRRLDEGEGDVGRRRGRPRALCRVDGEQHDVSAICPHLGGVVRWNDADQTWDCPLHGSRFRADGAVRHGPSTQDLR